GHAIRDESAEQRQARLQRIPMHRRDLVGVEADEAITAFECVIEEGELVLARERRQPERELRQLNRTRVLVDAVEAALRNEAFRMQLLVLVIGDAWPCLWPACPSLHQPRCQLPAGLY